MNRLTPFLIVGSACFLVSGPTGAGEIPENAITLTAIDYVDSSHAARN